MKSLKKASDAWTPQEGTQLDAILASWCPEIFFGGARGGGKSDFLLGDFAQFVNIWGKNWHGIIFRQNFKSLAELQKRANDIYPKMGAYYLAGKSKWVFKNGATLTMAFIERPEDVKKYQGHQYTWIGFDELPHWPTPDVFLAMMACLRSAHGVENLLVRATGNPGGVGQEWVKQRYITPNPNGYEPLDTIYYINIESGKKEFDESRFSELAKLSHWAKTVETRMFIPSKLTDNKILMKNDPTYISRLAQSGSEALVRAWLAGDWNAVEGAYFDKFDADKHILKPFEIPKHWTRFRAFDWGHASPFCCLWLAVSDGSLYPIPNGALVVYREYYGGKNGKGIGLENTEIAQNILNYERGETMDIAVADPSIFAHQGGISISEQMAEYGCYWMPADNKRIAGWQQIRERLNPSGGEPMLYILSHCHNLIRTLPSMVHDPKNAEDLDTKLEDHALDTLRYACMTRPIVAYEQTPFSTAYKVLQEKLRRRN